MKKTPQLGGSTNCTQAWNLSPSKPVLVMATLDQVAPSSLVEGRRDVSAAAVEHIGDAGGWVRDGRSGEALAPGVATVSRLRDEGIVALEALLVGAVDEADVDGAVGADARRGVLVELVTGVAHADGTDPGAAVVIGVREIDGRAAEAVELSPGDVEAAEVVAGPGAGVHCAGLMVGKL